MGKSYQADIPGNILAFQCAIAAQASQTATTTPVFVAPADCTIVTAYTIASASQDSSTNVTQALTLVNNGTAGTGTTVLASVGVTGSVAASKPRAYTVTSGNSVDSGSGLTYVHTNGSTGVAQNACMLVVKYRLL
jgi:hypothetical protein